MLQGFAFVVGGVGDDVLDVGADVAILKEGEGGLGERKNELIEDLSDPDPDVLLDF